DVIIRGRTYHTRNTYGIQQNNDLTIHSGQGQITLHGKTRTDRDGDGVVLANGGTTNGFSLVSDKATGTAVEIIGEAHSYGVNSGSGGSTKTIEATGGGDVIIDGQTPRAGYGVYLRDFDVLAADGAVTIDGHTTGIWLYDMTLGQLDNTLVASSDADVTLKADTFRTSGSSSIDTAGNVVIEPHSASFKSNLVFPLSNVSLDSKASSLRLGKADNTNDVDIDNAVLINGPIDVHGKNIAIDGALTAVAANINLFATGTVTQTAGLEASGIGLNGPAQYTLQSEDNLASRLAAGSSATPVGSLSYVNGIGGVRIGEVNPTGIHATGAVLIETLNGNIVVEEPINSDSTLNAVTGYTGAVVLNAGRDQDIGIPEGGNVQVIGDGDISAPGIIKLYGGVRSKSTGVPSLAGGDDNIRVGVNKTTTDFDPVLTDNETHALFRAVARGEGNLIVVTSGGGDEDVEWDYRAESGSLSTLVPEATIDASELLTRLQARDLVVSANTITVDSAIEATTTNNDLSLHALSDIIVKADIDTNGGHLVLRAATSEGTDKGAIIVHEDEGASSTTTIDTQGGHIWLGGGFADASWNGLTVGDGLALLGIPKREVPQSSDVIYAGIAIDSAQLTSGGGDVSFNAGALVGVDPISGETHRETGLALLGDASINTGAGTLSVTSSVASDDGHGLALIATDNEAIVVDSASSDATTEAIAIQATTASTSQAPIDVTGEVTFNATSGAPVKVNVDNAGASNGVSLRAGAAWGLLTPSTTVELDLGGSGLDIASDAALTLASDDATNSPSSADVSMVFSTLNGPVVVNTTGDVSAKSPANTAFGATLDTQHLSLSGPPGDVQLGQVGNTSDITLAQALEATTIGLIGDTITINDALTADRLEVTAASDLTQSSNGDLDVADLRVRGTAAVDLDQASNTIDRWQLRGSTSQLASLDLQTTGDIAIGGTAAEPLRSSGAVIIETTTGNIDVDSAVVSDSTQSPAITINAGRDKNAGDVDGGDIRLAAGAEFTVGSGGQVRLFSGTAANSTGVLAQADTVQSFVDEDETDSLTNLGQVNALFRSAVAEQITIVQAPDTGTDSGATLSSVKVALADGFGNTLPLDNEDITVALFSASGVQLSGTLTASTTADGEASFSDLVFTGLVGSSARLRFSANGVDPAIPATISEPITITGAGSAATAASTITATPAGNIKADGADASLLVVSVTDAAGNPITGQAVGLTDTAAPSDATIGLEPISGTTNLLGQFAAELTNDTAGDVTVKACLSTNCASAEIGSVDVGFIAGPPAKIEVEAGNNQPEEEVNTPLPTLLKVKVTDASTSNNPVDGATVQFAGDGSASPETAVTDSSGIAETTWTLGETAGTQTLTATLPGATTDSDTVDFTATAGPGPFDQLGLSVGDQRLLTTIPFDLDVTLQDEFGNTTTHTSNVELSVTHTNESFDANLDGAESGSLDNTTLTIATGSSQDTITDMTYGGLSAPSVEAGDILLTAEDNSNGTRSGELSVTVRDIELEISADPASIEAGSDELATITATLQDINEDGVADQPMAFETTLGYFVDDNGQALGPVAQLTGDSTGQATIKLQAASSEGEAEVTVRSRGADPATTAVDFTGGEAVASQSTLRVEPSVLSTDGGGVDTATVTLQLRDQFGNTTDQLPDNTPPALTLTNNLVTLSGTLTDQGGGEYTQTIDATTTAGVEEITATIGGEDTAPATVTLVAGPPSQLTRVSGDGQAGPVGQALPNPVVVRLVDENNNAIANKNIAFGVDSGSVSAASVSTDLQGFAATTWTLGTASGAQSLTASYEVDTSTTIDAQFSATAQPGTPTQLSIDTQPDATQSGEPLTTAPVVVVLDDNDNVVSDATGQVEASLDAGGVPGRLSGTTVVDLSGGQATFTGLVLGGEINQDFTIEFASPGLGSVTSESFQLSEPGEATNIVILNSADSPDLGEQWQNLPFDFKARVTDEFTNTVTLSGDETIEFSGDTLDAAFTAGIDGELLKARTREKVKATVGAQSTQPGDMSKDDTAPRTRALKVPGQSSTATGGEVDVDSAVYSGASAPDADDVIVTAVIVDSNGDSTGIEGTSLGFTVAPTSLSLSADDSQLLAKTNSQTTVTITLTSEGDPVTTPTDIDLEVNLGEFVDSGQSLDLTTPQKTDANGELTLTYQAGTTAGTATIKALCPGVCEAETTITIVPDYETFFTDVRSGDLVPTGTDYQAVSAPLGSTGSLALVTDAIIALPDQINDGAELTALVDLVDDITQASDGDAATEPNLTQADYQLLSLARIDSQDKRDLMNHILGIQPAGSVTEYTELVAIASATSKLVDFTTGTNNALGLSVSEFDAIGITGVTSNNLAAIVSGLEDQLPQTGALTDTATIQSIVNDLTSEAFDDLVDPNAGQAASPEQYGLAGISGVTAENVDLVNEMLEAFTDTQATPTAAQ
ncbi:MAG: invasin domain 3-containing protein, partial [Wenzhouxiangella sp.]|nr:invasin domain 3-containing protein [Wenzhouxiangella sp.]